jgi:hypothetical protein
MFLKAQKVPRYETLEVETGKLDGKDWLVLSE